MSADGAPDSLIVRQLLQPALFSEVLRFSKDQFAKSNYEPLQFNSVIARNTLRNAAADGSMRVFTAWRNVRCVGLLIGMIVPLPWSAGLTSTDLVFIAEQGGDMLLERFVKWSRENRVVRIDMGVGDAQRAAGYDRLYEREGFTRAGGLYYAQWPTTKGTQS